MSTSEASDPSTTTGAEVEVVSIEINSQQDASTSVQPGQRVDLYFEPVTERGVGWTLTGGSPETTYYLVSSFSESGEPTWTDSINEFDIPDIAIGGAGPDPIVIPDIATAGDYQLCPESDRRADLCTTITVAST
ncbi:MAG: hypothetical protein AAGF73_05620 [Actinomycetota bacterium]